MRPSNTDPDPLLDFARFFVIAGGALFSLLGLAWLGWHYGVPGLESRADYHFRQLTWHGKETKNADAQRYHGQALASGGEEGIALIVKQIEFDVGVRYNPGPLEMLELAGEPAREHLLRRIDQNHFPPIPPYTHSVTKQRARLNAALVLTFSDFSRFDQLLDDLKTELPAAGGLHLMMVEMEVNRINGAYGDMPSFFGPDIRLNPELVDWWKRRRP